MIDSYSIIVNITVYIICIDYLTPGACDFKDEEMSAHTKTLRKYVKRSVDLYEWLGSFGWKWIGNLAEDNNNISKFMHAKKGFVLSFENDEVIDGEERWRDEK